MVIGRRKRNKTPNEVKPMKTINVMRCAIWDQSLFDVWMVVRAHVNAC